MAGGDAPDPQRMVHPHSREPDLACQSALAAHSDETGSQVGDSNFPRYGLDAV